MILDFACYQYGSFVINLFFYKLSLIMISVCMATKNGERFVLEQIESILLQLGQHDELIISDDCSTDNTVKLITALYDKRIKLHQNANEKGVIKNFETGLSMCKGDFIFLADQDDVWLPDKLKVMMRYLDRFDLVVSDCAVADDYMNLQRKSFFALNGSRKGFLKNILKNSYMGCCMGFRKKVLERAVPFPKDIPMHDYWIGLIAELHYSVKFIQEVLVHHRRHETNTSTNGKPSSNSLWKKIKDRYFLIKNLFFFKNYAG
jgi:glycosyltransferase involved in cell wall biosynthesis